MFGKLIQILEKLGAFLGFFKDKIVNNITHAGIVTGQLTITILTVAFVVAFYFATITSLVAVYNLGIDIFNYASNPSGLQLTCFYGYMDCIGITAALQNGFALMYSALSTVVIFHLTKFTYSALKIIGNEFFKLGLLLGQALK